MLTKQFAKELQGDFIPGGKEIDIHGLTFRKTSEYKVYRCSARAGYDPQSGPIFCGDIAEIVADVIEDGQHVGHVALCNKRHKLPRDITISTNYPHNCPKCHTHMELKSVIEDSELWQCHSCKNLKLVPQSRGI